MYGKAAAKLMHEKKAKNGGAARRRFSAISEKNSWCGQNDPLPTRAKANPVFLSFKCHYAYQGCYVQFGHFSSSFFLWVTIRKSENMSIYFNWHCSVLIN